MGEMQTKKETNKHSKKQTNIQAKQNKFNANNVVQLHRPKIQYLGWI